MGTKEKALALAREAGREEGAQLVGTPAAKEAETTKEKRMLALGWLLALQDQEQTSAWLGEDGEEACCGVDDDEGEIWVEAEEAWIEGFVAGMQE